MNVCLRGALSVAGVDGVSKVLYNYSLICTHPF